MSETPSPTSDAEAQPAPAERLEAVDLGRDYARAGALWFALAALLALLGLLRIALGIGPSIAPFGVGRLHVAYRFLAVFAFIPLPLAGLMLADLREAAPLDRAKRGLLLWNAGLLAGCVAILLGFLRPEPAAGAPVVAELLIWLGILHWLSTIASPLLRRQTLGAAEAFALSAGVGLAVLLLLGMALLGSLRGFGQALASALYLRGLVDLWLLPLAVAACALLLPRLAAAPLFGRRPLLLFLFAWPAFAVLGLTRDLSPDMLAGWLQRPAEAATSLAMIPAVALAVGLLGTFVGAPGMLGGRAVDPGEAEARGSGDENPPGTASPGIEGRREQRLLLVVGLLLLLAGLWMEAWRLPASRRLLELGPWSAGMLFPTFGGHVLIASAAARALLPTKHPARKASGHAILAGALLTTFPLVAAGLAEAAIGGSGEMLVLQSRLRLPGALMLALGASLWAHLAFEAEFEAAGDAAGEAERRLDEDGFAAPRDGFPGASTVMSAVAFILAAGLIVSLLLPLADPGLDDASARAIARVPAAGSIRAEGQAVYDQEACAVCHTQRVRAFEAGGALGPATRPGDFAGAPSQAGQRRLGPDLSWAGDRYGDPEVLGERLRAHATGGVVAMPWLFQRGGPTSRGASLVEYLNGLRAQGSGAASPTPLEGEGDAAP